MPTGTQRVPGQFDGSPERLALQHHHGLGASTVVFAQDCPGVMRRSQNGRRAYGSSMAFRPAAISARLT